MIPQNKMASRCKRDAKPKHPTKEFQSETHTRAPS